MYVARQWIVELTKGQPQLHNIQILPLIGIQSRMHYTNLYRWELWDSMGDLIHSCMYIRYLPHSHC